MNYQEHELFRSTEWIDAIRPTTGETDYVILQCLGCGTIYPSVQRISLMQEDGGLMIVEVTPDCCQDKGYGFVQRG